MVQRDLSKRDFLRNHGLAVGRQWKVDLNAMNKTLGFYEYKEDDRPDGVDFEVRC